MRRFALAVVAVWVAAALAPPPAEAHGYAPCGDGVAMKYIFPDSYYYFTPGIWTTTKINAVDAAASSIRNNTDFDWYKSTSYEVVWDDLGSSDTSVAGYTTWNYSCSTHKIWPGALFINFPHFTGGHSTSQSAYQCVALHEFGHMMALAHNTVTSIMKQPHTSRCHSSLITSVQSHDISDINAKYP